jgi:hypothetical protein
MLLTNGTKTGTKKHFPMHKLLILFVYYGMEFESFYRAVFFENFNRGIKLKKRLFFINQKIKNTHQHILIVHPIIQTPDILNRIFE